MNPQNDEALVSRVCEGEQEAFAQLVQQHQGAVYSLCYRMSGDAAEAEDLAQEAFMRFYRSVKQFRPGARLRPWLHRITANVRLDALRQRQRREPMLSLDEPGTGSTEPPALRQEEMPEASYLAGEARDAVQQALLRLPGEYRIVLVLRYLEVLSGQGFAETLGLPLSTVEARIFRAKKMIAPLLVPSQAGGEEVA